VPKHFARDGRRWKEGRKEGKNEPGMKGKEKGKNHCPIK
jgi:hypothetical protein